jgi:hypothetical protein
MRTDIHRPSAINVEDYQCIGYLYLWPAQYDDIGFAMWNREERERINNLVRERGWHWSNHEHGGTCGICGATARFVGVFVHVPSGDVIYVGHECAANVEMGNGDAFDALKKRIHAEQERFRNTVRARKLVVEYGIPCMECARYSNDILADMWGKLVKYGSLSEAQVRLAAKLIDEIKNPKVREEEPAPTKEAPEGRVVVVGELLGLKTVESMYGTQVKMLVRSDDGGWKVWSTRPASLTDAERGSRIQFTAALKRSDKDAYFAYGSRPTKAKVLEAPAKADV